MEVTNNTSFPVIAFGVHNEIGYGGDVTIQPGESAHISGPYVGEMGEGSCNIFIHGKIACQEQPDDKNGFQIAKGMPICLSSGNKGVTIRHHEDPAEDQVLAWRAQKQMG